MTIQPKHPRNAVTLVEVLFAIGVILIGLVGLISVLPVAGRRAQDTINLNEGAAMANAVFDQLKANGYLKKSAWWVRNDESSLPGSPIDLTTGWCIDPLFVSNRFSEISESDNVNGQFFLYSPTTGNGYRRMLFPYYKEEHNPLVDPSEPTAGSAWPKTDPPIFQPRLVRVGFANTTGGPGPISGKEAQAIVDSSDGVAVTETEDRTLNVTLQGEQATSGGLLMGKKVTDGALSWIATCSQLPGTDYMSVSVVIFMNRERGFYTPRNTDGPVATPEENATAERLAYVTYANGFSGGAGGSVHIVGAQNTSPDLASGDWVMLSRETSGGGVHRWFRVVSVTSEPELTTVSDPNDGTTRDVWRQKLFLDGPDWSFGFPTPGTADGTLTDNTFVTIVDDVVAVSEHIVRMSP